MANNPAIIAPVEVPAIKSKYSPSGLLEPSLRFNCFSTFS